MDRKRPGDHRLIYDQLDHEYRENVCGDPVVACLNTLPAHERRVMIMYIALGCNKTALAAELGCCRQSAITTVVELQTKLKNRIKRKTETWN